MNNASPLVFVVAVTLSVILAAWQARNPSEHRMCAGQAQRALTLFQETFAHDDIGPDGSLVPTRTNYTRQIHYNQHLNKCFVLISYDFTYAGTLSANPFVAGETLVDACENAELATCVHSRYRPSGEERTCALGEGQQTISADTFEEFVNQRMERKEW
jgi:hypothetical protein